MYHLSVDYLGKSYDFHGLDSITLADTLETQFGKVIRDYCTESHSEYWTVRGAYAVMWDA